MEKFFFHNNFLNTKIMPTSGFCVFIFFTRIGDRELRAGLKKSAIR